MPNNKQGQGQGQGQHPNAGGSPGAREQVRDAAQQVSQGAQRTGDQLKQGAEQASDRLKQGYGDAREQALSGYRQVEESIAGNPLPSVLIGFGVGFGVGLVLISAFAGREQTWAEKYLPESLQDAPERYKALVSSLKSLPKTVQDNLPSNITRYFG